MARGPPTHEHRSHDSFSHAFFRQRRWSSNDTRWSLEASVSRKCRRRRNCQDTSRFSLTQKFASVSPVHLDATRILHVQLYTTVGTLPTMGHERRFLQRCHLQCRTSAAAAYRAPPPRPAPPPPPAALSASRVRTTHPTGASASRTRAPPPHGRRLLGHRGRLLRQGRRLLRHVQARAPPPPHSLLRLSSD